MIRAAAAAVAVLLAAGASLVAAGLSGCGHTPESPAGTSALTKVVAAEKSLVYTGTKRSVSGEDREGRTTRMKVSHYASGRTLLEWTRGVGESQRWSYRSRFQWIDDPDLLLKNYTVSLDPEDGPPVASRATRKLSIRGMRPHRPSLDLLVDRETWLVLREARRDIDGKLWLTTEFETIEYREPDAPAAQGAAEALSDPRADHPTEPLPLAVTAAPEGFVRVGGSRGPCGHERTDLDWVRRETWSDGLAAFSITESPAKTGGDSRRPPLKEGEIQRRQFCGIASIEGVFGGISVKVSGNLTAEELESVVRGLAPSR